MKPILYHKLLKLVEQDQLQSITVDLFDTLLLNRYWPESLRRSELAQIWLPALREHISSELTAAEVSDWYRFAEQLLLDSEQPVRFDLCAETMVSLLCHKYNVTLTREQQLELLITLISDRLNFTINTTHVNRHLLSQLSAIKQLAPKIKFYFITTSELTSDQIKTLLQIANITIFDDGICTAEANQPDPTFADLTKDLLADQPTSANFHLSAAHASYRSALDAQSLAYHYRPVRLRGVRTLAGQTIELGDSLTLQSRERSRYRKQVNSLSEANHLAQQLTHFWQCQLTTQLELCNNSAFLLPINSSTISEHPNLILAPNLDQSTILRAFVWLLASYDSPRWDAASLLQLLVKNAQIPNRLALYQVCFGESYITSEFIVNSRSEATFYANFLDEIRSNTPDNLQLMREAYATVSQYLPRDDKTLYYINLAHDHSAWVFREFARLHGLGNRVIDWRPAGLPEDFPLDTITLSPEYPLFHTELAPDRYLQQILRPRLKHLRQR